MQARTGAKKVFAIGDRLIRPATGLTVLIYHRVGGASGSEVDLDLDTFRAQLAHLGQHHDVLSLTEAVETLSNPGANGIDRSQVVITFDDGTADFVDVVTPALVDAGLPATLYVATAFVDEGREFPWGAPPATWAGLRESLSTGLVTIGSHTHTHALLDRSDPAAAADELDRSIELIGDRLGVMADHFAYPKALAANDAVDALVRERFVSAAVARSRVNRIGSTDVHQLSRTPIQRSDEMRWFRAKAAGGMRLEGELRHVAARIKYRASTA